MLTTEQVASTAGGISAKQVGYVRSLLEARTGLEEAEALRAQANAAFFAGALDNKATGEIIAALKAIPAKAQPFVPLALGYYSYEGDVYVARKSKTTGKTIALKMVFWGNRGKWLYAKGMQATLAKHATPLSIEQAAALGHLHGACAICGRELTDPKSVEQGIGPVCIKKVWGL